MRTVLFIKSVAYYSLYAVLMLVVITSCNSNEDIDPKINETPYSFSFSIKASDDEGESLLLVHDEENPFYGYSRYDIEVKPEYQIDFMYCDIFFDITRNNDDEIILNIDISGKYIEGDNPVKVVNIKWGRGIYSSYDYLKYELRKDGDKAQCIKIWHNDELKWEIENYDLPVFSVVQDHAVVDKNMNYKYGNKDDDDDEMSCLCVIDGYDYDLLRVSFLDVLGNDLIKGIGYSWWQSDIIPEEEAIGGLVNKGLFTIDHTRYPPSKILYNEAIVDLPGPPKPIYTVYEPTLSLIKENGFYYFEFSSGYSHPDPPAEIITRILGCPYVFGDEETHEIVTYWELVDPKLRPTAYANNRRFCNRIEFGGKEIPLQQKRESYINNGIWVEYYYTTAIITLEDINPIY